MLAQVHAEVTAGGASELERRPHKQNGAEHAESIRMRIADQRGSRSKPLPLETPFVRVTSRASSTQASATTQPYDIPSHSSNDPSHHAY